MPHDVTVTTRPDGVVEVTCATCKWSKPRTFHPATVRVSGDSNSGSRVVLNVPHNDATIYAIAHTLGINFAWMD